MQITQKKEFTSNWINLYDTNVSVFEISRLMTSNVSRLSVSMSATKNIKFRIQFNSVLRFAISYYTYILFACVFYVPRTFLYYRLVFKGTSEYLLRSFKIFRGTWNVLCFHLFPHPNHGLSIFMMRYLHTSTTDLLPGIMDRWRFDSQPLS